MEGKPTQKRHRAPLLFGNTELHQSVAPMPLLLVISSSIPLGQCHPRKQISQKWHGDGFPIHRPVTPAALSCNGQRTCQMLTSAVLSFLLSALISPRAPFSLKPTTSDMLLFLFSSKLFSHFFEGFQEVFSIIDF